MPDILIARITKILESNEGGLSIAGIHRALGEKDHRLYLTGYLEAFSQIGLIEEVDIKPSRVFRVKPGLSRFIEAYKLLMKMKKDREKLMKMLKKMEEDDEKHSEIIKELLEWVSMSSIDLMLRFLRLSSR